MVHDDDELNILLPISKTQFLQLSQNTFLLANGINNLELGAKIDDCISHNLLLDFPNRALGMEVENFAVVVIIKEGGRPLLCFKQKLDSQVCQILQCEDARAFTHARGALYVDEF